MATGSAASRLRRHAHKALTEEECTMLKACIGQFQETQSVLALCISLKNVIDSLDKILLLPYVHAMVPSHLQGDFEKLCKLQFQCYKPHTDLFPLKAEETPQKQNETARRGNSAGVGLVKEPSQRPIEEYGNIKNAQRKSIHTIEDWDCLTQNLARQKNSSASRETKQGLHKRSKTYHSSLTTNMAHSGTRLDRKGGKDPTEKLMEELSARNIPSGTILSTNGSEKKAKLARRVLLCRGDEESLGFCIRGGKDLNAGIYISEVDHGGQAENQGLKVGERILKVNDQVFDDITHAQAVVCLKSARQITMFVAPLGQMPGGIPDGTSTRSSHLSVTEAVPVQDSQKASSQNAQPQMGAAEPQKITVMSDEDGWLGFSIRGGVDQGIEPCVAHVDPQSPASRAGLSRGTKLHKVNGMPVSRMNHLDIVNLITVTRVVVLHVTEGRPEQRRSIAGKARSEKTTRIAVSSHREQPDESFSLKDLKMTPPMHSSTPLPKAGTPLISSPKSLLQRIMRRTTTDQDATIMRVLREDAKKQPRKSNRKPAKKKNSQKQLSVSGERVSAEKGTAEQGYSPGRGSSKLDSGTIKLNLIGESGNGGSDGSGKSEGDRSRMHIKEIFTSAQGHPIAEANEEPTNATNILSTPVLSHKTMVSLGHKALSPSFSELKNARNEASRQIRGELTGKHHSIPFTPNVPPSPTDGEQRDPSSGKTLSKIFTKVMRRSLGEELASNGNKGLRGFHHQMSEGGLVTSPYQMMTDRDTTANASTFSQ